MQTLPEACLTSGDASGTAARAINAPRATLLIMPKPRKSFKLQATFARMLSQTLLSNRPNHTAKK
jgi:hypothetical protein